MALDPYDERRIIEESDRAVALRHAKRLRDKLSRDGYRMHKTSKDASGSYWYRIVDDEGRIVIGERFTATIADCELFAMLDD